MLGQNETDSREEGAVKVKRKRVLDLEWSQWTQPQWWVGTREQARSSASITWCHHWAHCAITSSATDQSTDSEAIKRGPTKLCWTMNRLHRSKANKSGTKQLWRSSLHNQHEMMSFIEELGCYFVAVDKYHVLVSYLVAISALGSHAELCLNASGLLWRDIDMCF